MPVVPGGPGRSLRHGVGNHSTIGQEHPIRQGADVRLRDPHLLAHDRRGVPQLPADPPLATLEARGGDSALHGIGPIGIQDLALVGGGEAAPVGVGAGGGARENVVGVRPDSSHQGLERPAGRHLACAGRDGRRRRSIAAAHARGWSGRREAWVSPARTRPGGTACPNATGPGWHSGLTASVQKVHFGGIDRPLITLTG
jgi:hypothetical protein